jgi:hypothetical protein
MIDASHAFALVSIPTAGRFPRLDSLITMRMLRRVP